MYRKGQIFSYDLIFAVMVVSFLLWYAVTASNDLAERIHHNEKENRLAEVARSAIQQLSESPGDPYNWNDFSANSIGFAESRGVLDQRKVELFARLTAEKEGYDKARTLLSLNRQGGAHVFALRINGMGGSTLYSVGEEPPDDVSVSSASRIMALNGRAVKVWIRVWEPSLVIYT